MKIVQPAETPDMGAINHEAWKSPAAGSSFVSQSDSPLALEYVETIRRKSHLEPEKELMLAVLEQAILSYQTNFFKKTRRQENLLREVEQWIWADNQHWLYSFDTICETLDISPTFLRGKLLAWRQSQLTPLESVQH